MRMNRQRGFSLFEVLIALMVLSIGLLGIATLQAESMRVGQDALLRTKAINLAADMADRIRANPGGSESYVADADVAEPAVACADTADGPAPASCLPAAMAVYDIWQWQQTIAATAASGLPGGNGRIVRDGSVEPPLFTITINWDERGQPRSQSLTVQR